MAWMTAVLARVKKVKVTWLSGGALGGVRVDRRQDNASYLGRDIARPSAVPDPAHQRQQPLSSSYYEYCKLYRTDKPHMFEPL
jgi:hypothetical protein